MIVGTDDFGCQPEFARSHGDKREIGTDGGFGGKNDFRAGSEQPRAGEVGNAGVNDLMQARANQFMTRARRPANQGRTAKSFFIGLAHSGNGVMEWWSNGGGNGALM